VSIGPNAAPQPRLRAAPVGWRPQRLHMAAAARRIADAAANGGMMPGAGSADALIVGSVIAHSPVTRPREDAVP
jgi:hypothetical protein